MDGAAPDVEVGMQRDALEGVVPVSHRVVPWDEDLKGKRPLKHSKMDDPRWAGSLWWCAGLGGEGWRASGGALG
jgi:hypothetical protein